MADINLQEVHDVLIAIAREAGQMMLSAHPSVQRTNEKKNCTCEAAATIPFD